MAFIVATSGCTSANNQLLAKPSLEDLQSSTVAARAPVDRYDPLVYCGGSGAYRCPQVTPKTLDDTPVPAPVRAEGADGAWMRDAAARLTAGAPSAQVERVIRFDASMFLFDFNKAVLRDKAKAVLSAAAPDLAGRRLTIAGFTDDIGSDAYNEKLALRRAEAVRDFLVSQGVPADQISLKGEGRCCYVAQNDTEEGRQQNRRVEIRVEAAIAPEGAKAAAVNTLQSTK